VVLKKCVMINCAALGSNPSALYTELVFLVRSVSLPFWVLRWSRLRSKAGNNGDGERKRAWKVGPSLHCGVMSNCQLLPTPVSTSRVGARTTGHRYQQPAKKNWHFGRGGSMSTLQRKARSWQGFDPKCSEISIFYACSVQHPHHPHQSHGRCDPNHQRLTWWPLCLPLPHLLHDA